MKKLSLLVLPLIVGSFFIFPTNAQADAWNETFESYTTGDLRGQGPWDLSTSNLVDVSTTRAQAGTKSAELSAGNSGFYYSAAASSTDLISQNISVISGYVYPNTSSGFLYIYIKDSTDLSSGNTLSCFYRYNANTNVSSIAGGNNGTSTTTTDVLTRNAWNKIEILANYSTDTCSLRINNGTWSNNVDMDPAVVKADTLEIGKSGNDLDVWFDSFGQTQVTSSLNEPYITYTNPVNNGTQTSGIFDITYTITDPQNDNPNAVEFWLFKNNGNQSTTISLQNFTLNGSGPWSHTVSTDLEDGIYELVITPYSTITNEKWTNNGIQFSIGTGSFQDQYNNLYENLYASTTQATCTEPTSILDVGGGIRFAGCTLFVPNQTTLNKFATLSFKTKFPFAYISDFASTTAALSATEGQFASTTIGLSSLNIGTGTGIGNILPNISFGKGSIDTYLSSTMYNALIAMQGVVIWLGVAMYFYRKVTGMMRV